MKSLEHIIRDIREGKCCCEKKKDSLENSIRKVVRKESSYAAKDSKPVDEDVAGMMGSTDGKTYGESSKKVRKEDGDKLPGAEDKMDEGISVVNPVPVGNQFKSVRTQTPHIKPPAGPGSHSQAPENVSRQRTFAKERVSQTMGKDLHAEEVEQIAEAGVKTAVQGAEELLNLLKPKKFNAPVPYGTKTPSAPKANVPAKVVEPEVKTPAKVAEPEAETKVKVDTETKTPAKVDAEVKTKAPTVPEVGTSVKAPVETMKPVTVPGTTSVPGAKPSAAVAAPSKLATITKAALPAAVVAASIPGSGVSDREEKHVGKPKIQAPTKEHRAKKEKSHVKEGREEIENMPRKGDRKTIEYVGRKDADPKTTKEKTSRQATIKNVIDESKKLSNLVKSVVKDKERSESGSVKLDKPTKVFDYGNGELVVINPDSNKNTLDVKEGMITKGLVGLDAYDVAQKAAAGKPAQAGTSALSMLAGVGKASPIGWAAAASELMGATAKTEKGKAQGEWIAKNVPYAKDVADAMRKAGEYIGVRDKAEQPEKNVTPPLETKPEEKKKAPQINTPKTVGFMNFGQEEKESGAKKK